jgi:hypothetical protein
MLTFTLGTFSYTDASITFTGDGVLGARFTDMCTSFDHDPGETTFTGELTLLGYSQLDVYSSGTLVSTLTDPLEDPVLFTIVSATFDTVGSTGAAQLTFSEQADFDELSVTEIVGVLSLEDMSLVGTTAVVGTVSGDLTLLPGPSTVSAEPRPFSLTVGAVCF